jgi:hypothetical protein
MMQVTTEKVRKVIIFHLSKTRQTPITSGNHYFSMIETLEKHSGVTLAAVINASVGLSFRFLFFDKLMFLQWKIMLSSGSSSSSSSYWSSKMCPKLLKSKPTNQAEHSGVPSQGRSENLSHFLEFEVFCKG